MRLLASDVFSIDIKSAGVRSVPSILLVDAKGAELGSWQSPFSQKDQGEINGVVQTLLLEQVLSTAPTLAQLDASLSLMDKHVIVDTRPRSEFNHWHLRSALNIPFDELSVRLHMEVDREQQAFFFCGSAEDDPEGLTRCAHFLAVVRYDHAIIIPQTLEELGNAGIALERN